MFYIKAEETLQESLPLIRIVGEEIPIRWANLLQLEATIASLRPLLFTQTTAQLSRSPSGPTKAQLLFQVPNLKRPLILEHPGISD